MATRAARRQYGIALRLRQAFERGLQRRVQRLLQSQAPGIARAARASDPLGAIGVRVAADLDVLERDLRASYVAAGTAMGEARTRALDSGRRFLDQRVVAFARQHGLDRAKQVSAGTVAAARRVLERELEAGSPTLRIAAELERATRALSRPRSIVIARTEVGIASGFADFDAAEQSGQDLVKVWLTAADGGPRHPSEPGLEGQRRALDEPFDVRGFEGAHPLALELPASEVVNCRCSVAYERA